MSVGFRYTGIWKEFGDGDLLHSFFLHHKLSFRVK